MEPQLRFCTSADGTRIGYTTYGKPDRGPVVSVHHWALVHSVSWRDPFERVYFEELASDRQVISFDRRGVGASQRDVNNVSLAAQVADLTSVVDHAGLDTFDMAGFADGAAIAACYAARHPDHVSRLVLAGAYSQGEAVATPQQTHSITTLIRENWPLGRRVIADLFVIRDSIESRRQFARDLDRSVSSEVAASYVEHQNTFDIRGELAEIRSPTLILDPTRPAMWHSAALTVAALVPGARLVTREGYDHAELSNTLKSFFDEDREESPTSITPQGMTAILFADIVDSTALTERLGDTAFRDKARKLDAVLRTIIRDNAGTPIEGKLLGDGVLATFTSARQAIEAALACGRAGEDGGLPLHLGLHAGDVIREDNNVYGGAVNIAARISGLSAPGEVLVSDTVRSLARTSAGVTFEDRGEQPLKGVSEPVRVWAVLSHDV